MSYLDEMRLQLDNEDFPGFMRLWEEYRTTEDLDEEEFLAILLLLKKSDSCYLFGPYAEEAVPLWEKIEDEELGHKVLRLIIDIETTNSPQLGELVYQYLNNKFGDDKLFKEKIRLIGLRNRDDFRGSISNYELLNHMEKGNHIFHTGGWGVGEILDISLVREELVLEFENVLGKKDLSFEMAFKNFIPLPKEHFLARRFGDPDALEAETQKDPIKILRGVLRDLGPKTAAEIKDEFCELVIPEADWSKWWQVTRAKIKKDTMIDTPSHPSKPFTLHEVEVSHSERCKELLAMELSTSAFIQNIYTFTRNFPEVLKDQEVKSILRERLLHYLAHEDKTEIDALQIYIFLEDFYGEKLDNALSKLILDAVDIEAIIKCINIASFKKRILMFVREIREDWVKIFSNLLFVLPYHFLRDYTLKELNKVEDGALLHQNIKRLLEHPTIYPEAFIWYFQQLLDTEDIPFANKEGQCQFFEALFILLYHLESNVAHRDLVKKVHALIANNRYAVMRTMIADTSIESVREILLLASKCHTFTSHDQQILHSLAKVVHPSLERTDRQTQSQEEELCIWTTQEGFNKIQEKIHHIATIETVENAKEIEAARALGDLRENSEYKFAQEKRARLQSELKVLSDQLKQARVLTPDDIDVKQVDIGTIVEFVDPADKMQTYTILGPLDAEPEKNILSYQSQLAQSMKGTAVGSTFNFRGVDYTVKKIVSYLS